MRAFSRLVGVLTLTVLLFINSAFAQEVKNGLTWYTDIQQAYEVSNKSNKPIFAFFTGSDWCGWCHRLEKNVFDKPGFKEWAKQNVILLELDFPRNKKLPDALAQQNAELQTFFQVQGYPTIWIFNMRKDDATKKMNISALGSLMYPQSAPGKEEETFLASANALLKNKK
jgi:protein disulfide-isomerase